MWLWQRFCSEQERRDCWHTLTRAWLLRTETMIIPHKEIQDNWHKFCPEKIPLKSFSLMTMSSEGDAGCHIDFHWKSVKLITERRTVSLHPYKCILFLWQTSPTLMVEHRIISVAYSLYLKNLRRCGLWKRLNLMVSIAKILATVWKVSCSCGKLLSVNPLP